MPIGIDGGGGGGAAAGAPSSPSLVITNTAVTPQSIPNNAFTPVQFDTENLDTDAMFDTGASNTDITIPSRGLWLFSFAVQWTHNDTGERYVSLYDAGSQRGSDASDGNELSAFNLEKLWTCVIPINASVVVNVRAFQNSGGGLSFVNNVVGPRLCVSQISTIPAFTALP